MLRHSRFTLWSPWNVAPVRYRPGSCGRYQTVSLRLQLSKVAKQTFARLPTDRPKALFLLLPSNCTSGLSKLASRTRNVNAAETRQPVSSMMSIIRCIVQEALEVAWGKTGYETGTTNWQLHFLASALRQLAMALIKAAARAEALAWHGDGAMPQLGCASSARCAESGRMGSRAS